MDVRGEMLIGGASVAGHRGTFRPVNPATGSQNDPPFGRGGQDEVERACALAPAAFDRYRETDPKQRAKFLETCASNILDLGDKLVDRATAETGLSRARIEGERGRTAGQLRLFAGVVRDGEYLSLRHDTPLPDRKPLPRSDLRLRNVPLGPVVVVAHPGTSELVGRAVQAAVAECGLH